MRIRDRWRRILAIAAAIIVAAVSLWLLRGPGGSEGVSVTFLGGAREVGGSCMLVSAGETRFLVDCGSFGGSGRETLPEDLPSVSFMILTHAHTDHCGRIPELFAAGFKGEVYCTPATADLVPIMLQMSRSFERDRVDRGAFERALESIKPVPFGERKRCGRVSFALGRAQHLLGAAFAEVEIDTGERSLRIVFSGDIGSGASVLLRPAESPGAADYAVIETTYGGRVRAVEKGGLSSRFGDFGRAVGSALRSGGDVLIPAFTLGRTQEVMAALDMLTDAGIVPQGTEIFIDSPTARKVTEVYRSHPGELSSGALGLYGNSILSRPNHREVKSGTSMKVHGRSHRPTVFISSSGDLSYANSPRHLARMASVEKNLLCIVGWQSPGSVGGRLADGDSTVFVRYREDGETKEMWLSPSMDIRKFDAFSSHADQEGLVGWAASIAGLRKAFPVHGELDQSESLARRLEADLDVEVHIPEPGETVFLPSR